MRRLATLGLLALSGLAATFAAMAGPASAAPSCIPDGCVRVVQISGLIDPILADFMQAAVGEANATPGTIGVVLQLDSDGTVLDNVEFDRFMLRMRDSTVPVTAWVGTGAHAYGGAAELVAVLRGSTMAPGARIGNVGSQRLSIDTFGDLFAGESAGLRSADVNENRAKELRVIDRIALTAGDHLVGLSGVTTRQVTDKDGAPKLEPKTVAVIAKLGLWNQLLHTAASPAVSYLLLSVGVGLLIFEFFTAGIGIAGLVGAGSFALAGYGLGVLPTRPWALVILGLSAVAYGIDTQAGIPRFWAGIGTVGWIAGSWFLFDGADLPWLSLVVGAGGLAVAMVSGMPAMIRSRFGTPTIGREWIIGAEGVVIESVSPDGVVEIDGATWRARTNRATPLGVGDRLKVAAIDGLTLEVEPLEGAAQDYREKRH